MELNHKNHRYDKNARIVFVNVDSKKLSVISGVHTNGDTNTAKCKN